MKPVNQPNQDKMGGSHMTEDTKKLVEEDIPHKELVTRIFFQIHTRKGNYLSIENIEKKLFLKRVIKYIKRSTKCHYHSVFYTQKKFLWKIQIIVKITGHQIRLMNYQQHYGQLDD
jgi:hypothetical protein